MMNPGWSRVPGNAVVFLFLLVIVPETAIAQEVCGIGAAREAARLSREALAAFDAGNYVTARDMYVKVTSLCPSTDAFWALARCYEELKETKPAIAYLKRVAEASKDPGRVARAQLKIRELSELGEEPVTVMVGCEPSGVHVAIGEEPPVNCPLETRLKPGLLTMIARLDGYNDALQEVLVKPGQETRVVFSMTPSPASPQQENKSIVSKWWFWTIIGTTVAASITLSSLLVPKKESPATQEGVMELPLLTGDDSRTRTYRPPVFRWGGN